MAWTQPTREGVRVGRSLSSRRARRSRAGHVRRARTRRTPRATVQQIADEFGVTRPTIYRHLQRQTTEGYMSVGAAFLNGTPARVVRTRTWRATKVRVKAAEALFGPTLEWISWRRRNAIWSVGITPPCETSRPQHFEVLAGLQPAFYGAFVPHNQCRGCYRQRERGGQPPGGFSLR